MDVTPDGSAAGRRRVWDRHPWLLLAAAALYAVMAVTTHGNLFFAGCAIFLTLAASVGLAHRTRSWLDRHDEFVSEMERGDW